MKKGLLVFLAVLLALPVAYAAISTVCPSGCDYSTITACFNAINNTDGSGCNINESGTYTISGAYTYNLTRTEWGFDPQLQISANDTTLDCNGATFVGKDTYESFEIGNEWNYFENLTVKNCNFLHFRNPLDINHVVNPIITDNEFELCGKLSYEIVMLNNVIGGRIENNNFLNNTEGGGAGWEGGYPIHISYGTNNTIIKNNYINGGRKGITLYAGTLNITIINNTIIGMNDEAVYCWNPENSNSNIINNTISNCEMGIYLTNSSHEIVGNNIDHSTIGIVINGVNNAVTGNSVTNSTVVPNSIISTPIGIYLYGGSNNNVTDNTVTKAQYGIVVGAGSPDNLIFSNIFERTTLYGVMIQSSNNTISGNTVRYNNATVPSQYKYYSSNHPRNWNAENWSDTQGGENTGLYYLFTSDPYGVLVASDDTDVSLVATGANNLNLVLFNWSAGYTTAIITEAAAENCTAFDAWLTGLTYANDCHYFEPDVWVANGAGNNYTDSFNASTTTTSGFSEPSLTVASAVNIPSGGILISSGSGNVITSNTLSYNSVGIRVNSSDNTLSGNTIDLSNTLSLYVASDINITINSLTISSPVANYGLSKDTGLLSMSNSYGNIRWTTPSISLNKNYGSYLYIGNKFISLDPTQLPELDTKANVTLTGINCGSFKLYHYTGFASDLATIIGSGTIVATQANIGGDCTDDTVCKNVVCTAGTLTFEAQHFDGFGGENGVSGGTGNVSINLTEEISIIVNFNIDFGNGRVDGDNSSAALDSDTGTSTNGSWSFSSQYIMIKNDGTVNETINITSDKAAAAFIGGTGAEFKIKGKATEANACAGTLQTNYFEVLTSTQNVCSLLRFGTLFDQFNVSTRLLIPSDASPGKKESVLTFTAKKV